MRGIGILFDKAHGVAHRTLVDVGNAFTEKFLHPRLVELLQTVEQFKVRVVSHALPIKFQLVRIFGFIHQFAQEQIHQFVERIFTPRNIVLAQDGGEFVILFLLVGFRNGL